MKKCNIVKKKYEFDSIIKQGQIIKNSYYVIYYMNNNLDLYRFGISVSKKLGNAVFRNRYKRKIRNIIDNNKKYYQNNMDYIIIMRNGCIDADFTTMEKMFISLISKQHNKGESNEK